MNALNTAIAGLFASPAWALLIALGWGAAAYGLGHALLSRAPQYHSELLKFALGLAGLGVIFQQGFLVFYVPCWLWGSLLGVVAGYGAFYLMRQVRQHYGATLSFAAIVLLTLGAAMLPPYGWDEQIYQLALPERFLQTQSCAVLSDNPYSGFPMLPNFLYLAGIKLGGLSVPRLLNVLLTPMLLLYVFQRTRASGKFVAWSLTLAVALSPVTMALNRTVYVENFLALFMLAGIEAAEQLRAKPLWCGIVAGILAGAAASVKLTGAGAALLIALFLPRKSRVWASFVAASGLVAGGFYLRPLIQTGNLFYPFALGAEPGSVAEFHQLLGSLRYGLSGVQGVVTSWIFASIDGKLYDGIALGGQFLLLVGITTAGLWYLKRQGSAAVKKVVLPAGAVVIGYLFWVLTSQQTRFLFPVALYLAVVAGQVLGALPERFKKLSAVLILVGALAPPLWWPHAQHYVLGWKIFPQVAANRAHFLAFASRDPGYFQALNFLATTLPNSRVLLLCERRGLYVPRPYQIASPRFESSLTPLPGNAAELWQKIQHFDYILWGETTQDVDFQEFIKTEYATLAQYLQELLQQGKLQVVSTTGYPVLAPVKSPSASN